MKKYYTYIKIALMLFLLIFIITDLAGDKNSKADIQTVAAQVAAEAGYDSASPAENRMVKRFYGMNVQDYAGVVLYAPQDNMDARELLIVKLADQSQKSAVEASIESRLATQKKSFDGYGAEQTKLLNDHMLVIEGNYILYMVGENQEPVRKAFLKSL
ncbi:MAG: DUF4358 domain-containing protein [Blautia sp.]|nr:DUF4358 domain-containing protein [Blautia sp.]